MTPTFGFCRFAIPNMFDNDRVFLSLRFGGESAGSSTNWGEGTDTGGTIGCWWDCGGRRGGGGMVLDAGSLGNVLVLA